MSNPVEPYGTLLQWTKSLFRALGSPMNRNSLKQSWRPSVTARKFVFTPLNFNAQANFRTSIPQKFHCETFWFRVGGGAFVLFRSFLEFLSFLPFGPSVRSFLPFVLFMPFLSFLSFLRWVGRHQNVEQGISPARLLKSRVHWFWAGRKRTSLRFYPRWNTHWSLETFQKFQKPTSQFLFWKNQRLSHGSELIPIAC